MKKGRFIYEASRLSYISDISQHKQDIADTFSRWGEEVFSIIREKGNTLSKYLKLWSTR